MTVLRPLRERGCSQPRQYCLNSQTGSGRHEGILMTGASHAAATGPRRVLPNRMICAGSPARPTRVPAARNRRSDRSARWRGVTLRDRPRTTQAHTPAVRCGPKAAPWWSDGAPDLGVLRASGSWRLCDRHIIHARPRLWRWVQQGGRTGQPRLRSHRLSPAAVPLVRPRRNR
jgi:hypothetical protein